MSASFVFRLNPLKSLPVESWNAYLTLDPQPSLP